MAKEGQKQGHVFESQKVSSESTFQNGWNHQKGVRSILDNEWQYKNSDTVSLRYKYLWQEFLKWSINVKIDTFQISNGALKKWKN